MNNKHIKVVFSIVAAALCGGFCLAQAAPMGTAFTYQGRLVTASGPAAGNYEFKFSLYDAVSGGAQVAATQGPLSLAVTGGLFTVLLDFGPVFQGDLRYLEIMVRTNGGPSWTTLPRQPLTPSPNAVFATRAGSADGVATNTVSSASLALDPLSLKKVSGGSLGISQSPNGSVWFDVGDVYHTAPGVNTFIDFRGTSDAGAPRDWIVGSAGDNERSFGIWESGSGPDKLAFFIERNSGNVGIGTNYSPAAKLHVVGDAMVSSNVTISGSLGIGTNSPEVALHVVSDGYYAGLIESRHTAGTSFVLRSHPPGVAKVEWSLNMQPADDPYGHAGSLYFLSGGNTVSPTGTPLVLATNGNVGIGMDPTVRLDVSGDIKANSKSVAVGEESLRIVRGVVDWNGNVYSGSGFTSTKVGTGAYKVTFTTAFTGLPVVTATAEVPSGTGLDMIACMIMTNTASAVTIGTRGTTGAGFDRRFHFIAIGPR